MDCTTPSTQPSKCAWICADSQPSVAPPSASPIAAPARLPTARSASECPFTDVSFIGWTCRPARARGGGPAGACVLLPDRVPPVDEPLRQLVEADLVRQVLAELR